MLRFLSIILIGLHVLITGCDPSAKPVVADNNDAAMKRKIVKPGKKVTGDRYYANRINDPITVDGILNEQVWIACDTLSGLKKPKQNGPVGQQTQMKIAYDDEAIYFAFIFEDSNSPNLHAIKNNSYIWEDDRIAIFIDPDSSDPAYLHFAVNGNGRKMEGSIGKVEYEEPHLDWNPPWQAAVVKKPGKWQVEVSIPFKTIEFQPQSKDIWKINICRQATANGHPVYYVWNTQYGGFHYCGNKLIFE